MHHMHCGAVSSSTHLSTDGSELGESAASLYGSCHMSDSSRLNKKNRIADCAHRAQPRPRDAVCYLIIAMISGVINATQDVFSDRGLLIKQAGTCIEGFDTSLNQDAHVFAIVYAGYTSAMLHQHWGETS